MSKNIFHPDDEACAEKYRPKVTLSENRKNVPQFLTTHEFKLLIRHFSEQAIYLII